MDPTQRSKRVPIVLGALVIVAGLALGLFGRRERPDAPSDGAPVAPTTAPTTPATAETLDGDLPEEEPPEEAPDLSGPDVGELVVAGASDAHGLEARDGRLVWITTERAEVGSARYDGADVVVLHRDESADRFGGAFARDRQGVYFSVAGGDGPEPIFFVPAAALHAPPERLEPVAHGSSPDCFVATGELFAWADLGTLRRMAPGAAPIEIARRPGRIAAAAASDETLYWIETPYAGAGAHALMEAPLGGGEPKTRAPLAVAERDTLAASKGVLFWSETVGDEHLLVRLAEGGPETLARGALVTSLVVAGDRVFWAERHGDEPVSLLRSAPIDGTTIVRHGRHTGPITALAVADGQLFFSGRDGLYRAALEPGPVEPTPD